MIFGGILRPPPTATGTNNLLDASLVSPPLVAWSDFIAMLFPSLSSLLIIPKGSLVVMTGCVFLVAGVGGWVISGFSSPNTLDLGGKIFERLLEEPEPEPEPAETFVKSDMSVL